MENVDRSPVTKPKLLDLNLPAPEESEEDSHCQFFSRQVRDKFWADFHV